MRDTTNIKENLNYILKIKSYLYCNKVLFASAIFALLFLLKISIYPAIADSVDIHSLDDLYYGKNNGKVNSRVKDPLESLNRTIFLFNSKIITDINKNQNSEHKTIRRKKTGLESVVKNFFQNIAMPLSSINFILQNEPEKALTSIWRFFINSTLGFGGVLDVASSFKLESSTTSFTETLNKYHIDYGMYFVLPFIGPTTLKDMIAFMLNFAFNPIVYFVPSKLIVFLMINAYTAYNTLDHLSYNSLIMEDSLDGYAKLRSLYIQMQ